MSRQPTQPVGTAHRRPTAHTRAPSHNGSGAQPAIGHNLLQNVDDIVTARAILVYQRPLDGGCAGELVIDFQAEAGQRTTRVDQALETLQGALFSARAGRLALDASGRLWTIGVEGDFDRESATNDSPE